MVGDLKKDLMIGVKRNQGEGVEAGVKVKVLKENENAQDPNQGLQKEHQEDLIVDQGLGQNHRERSRSTSESNASSYRR